MADHDQTGSQRAEPSWSTLKDEELLKLRICDLHLTLARSSLQEQVENLFRELGNRKLGFMPTVYFGDEWFSPEGVVAIAVPFYLAHPRLLALEKTMMLEAEGEHPEYFMKLIRHEAGHCFDHAFGFSKRRRWRELFGSPDLEYNPDTYRPRPYSRAFVRNLENWYAQAHPDEDFAETFAAWLDPSSSWKEKYRGWPSAMEKLEYIDRLAQETSAKAVRAEKGYLPCSASKMKTTLEKYYAKRRREQAEQYPDFFDGDLRRIFNGEFSLSKREFGAAGFMRRQRREILDSVSYWTGENKFAVNALVKRLITRCDELNLRLGKSEAQTNLEVSAYLATLVTHHLFTGRFKRKV